MRRYPALSIAADMDGDGHQDLLVVNGYGRETLLRSVGGRRFVDWTDEGGLPVADHGLTSGACLLDADLDGDLDIYLGDLRGPDKLLVNGGRADFVDATEQAGIETWDGTTQPLCTDVDRDGDVDVLLPTWGRGLAVLENRWLPDAALRFIAHRSFVDAEDPGSGRPLSTEGFNAIAVADLDHDGRDELFLAAQQGCDRLVSIDRDYSISPHRLALPASRPCMGTSAAEFIDLDGDGDLDLVASGMGGLRFYERTDDGFSWQKPAQWDDHARRGNPKGVVIATFDVDGDGHDEVLGGYDRSPHAISTHWLARDVARSIVITLVGPTPNASAIGARVSLFEITRDSTRKLIGSSEVLAPTGGRSQRAPRQVFYGLTPGSRYEAVITVPGQEPWTEPDLAAGSERHVTWGRSRPERALATMWYRARTAHGDANVQRCLFGAMVAFLLVAATSLLLFRGRPTPAIAWGIAFGVWPTTLVLTNLVPADPGWPLALSSSGLALTGCVAALAFVRGKTADLSTPEMLVELSFSLQAFRHNQTPCLALNRLLFVLENASRGTVSRGSSLARLLVEDARAFRELAYPEIVAIRRLRQASGLSEHRAEQDISRVKRLLNSIVADLKSDLPEGAAVRVDASALLLSLQRIDEWLRRLRDETAQRLAIDVAEVLAGYVETRRGRVPCGIGLHVDADAVSLRAVAMGTELYRALDVLVENAARAMKGQENPRVEIDVRASGNGRLRIDVRDFGPGIAPEVRDRLFLPGSGDASGGHGFGLHYARRAVERLGGGLHLVEGGSKGACFGIELIAVSGPGSSSAAAQIP
ncbi:MAG: sensor histidine kinase [Acidobacteria bacterium]|nr:sensor histidine kinase [Acidobacteriota bacterium]